MIDNGLDPKITSKVQEIIHQVIPDFEIISIHFESNEREPSDMEIHGKSSIFVEEDKNWDGYKAMQEKTMEVDGRIENGWDSSWGNLGFVFTYIDEGKK